MNYYKCTRPDGTDFQTGTIDYAAAFASGEVITHPAKRVKGEPATYLSVSIAPADCTGMAWPCRLFRVEPVGRAYKSVDLKHKRECSALRVVEELPAWQALGPNGQQVAALVEQARTITPDQLRQVVAASDAAWAATARDAARAAARAAAWAAAKRAAARRTNSPAWAAVWAYVVRDLITPEQFQTLAGPWISVMGVPT